jgi:hypothetical protein
METVNGADAARDGRDDTDIDHDRPCEHHLRQDQIGISRGRHRTSASSVNCAKSRDLA